MYSSFVFQISFYCTKSTEIQIFTQPISYIYTNSRNKTCFANDAKHFANLNRENYGFAAIKRYSVTVGFTVSLLFVIFQQILVSLTDWVNRVCGKERKLV